MPEVLSAGSRRVQIPAVHGHLEGLLHPADAPFAAVVVCHPHPQFGGTMNNNVVYRTAKALGDAGAAVLRFNFRGVRGSTGRYDNGVGEEDDVRAALDYLQSESPGAPLWIAGFSFGARVGLTVGTQDSRVEKLLGIGLALTMFDYQYLTTCRKPKAFIQASEDEYGDRAAITALVASLPEPKRLFVVEGATHLFPKHLDPLEQAARDAITFLRAQ